MDVVRTYADDGLSGLRLENRRGLQNLLSDVITGQADFETILVLDVTRWGRFQDTDESAAYEFMCRKAGAEVVYCAESFDSESDLLTSVLTAGNIIVPRFADRALMATAGGLLLWSAMTLALYPLAAENFWALLVPAR